MNTEMKNRLLELLDNYHKRARLIALLRYELAHPAQVTEKDLIGAMNFARQEGAGRPEGHISNKTLYIALNYQDRARQLNAETFQEISAQLMKLEQEQDRLNYYLSLLEPRQEQVLRKAYLEKVPQGRALMTAMDQAEPVRPGPGPAEQGIHRDLGLIGVPAVEVHGDDSALHGRLPPLSRRRAGNALLPL